MVPEKTTENSTSFSYSENIGDQLGKTVIGINGTESLEKETNSGLNTTITSRLESGPQLSVSPEKPEETPSITIPTVTVEESENQEEEKPAEQPLEGRS